MTAPAFLALAGPADMLRPYAETIAPPADTTTRLNRVFEHANLIVFADPDTPVTVLPGGRGGIVGRIYGGGAPYARKVQFSDDECRAIDSQGTTALIRRIWGCYVAFLITPDGMVVFRDPSATAIVHHQTVGAVDLYFSDLALLDDVPTAPMTVDEDFVRHWLTFPHLRSVRTGIKGISEIPPGSAQLRSPSGLRSVAAVWTPWQAIQDHGLVTDSREAAVRLHDAAVGTVAALTRSADRPVLELSGGLDSSILAACLAESGIPFQAATFATMSPDGDERHYAGLVAKATGAKLHELMEEELPIILDPPPHALRPRQSTLLQPVRRALERFAIEHEIRTFLTGGGGDNLFCYMTTTAPILDSVNARGFWTSRSTVVDVAAMSQATVWTAVRYAIGKYRRLKGRAAWRSNTAFLAEPGIDQHSEVHPWLEAPKDAPIGTQEHIEMLVRHHYFLDQDYPAGTTSIRPLINQPLNELCLSIPTWLWVEGGVNRAVARRAFASRLPPQIIYRRTKGRLESMSYRRFTASRERIRPLLLDGALAGRGLIDRPAIADYLGEAGRPADELYYRVLDLVSMELWLRSWGG